jgi:hypothetical protein
MSDTQDAPHTEEAASESEAWKEVGSQFRELGESLSAAFQAAWQHEEVRQHAQEMKTGLEAMVKQLGRAIDETVSSPDVQSATHRAVRAGEHAAREARPHLIKALRQINDELQRLADRMEEQAQAAEGDKPREGG